MTVEELIEKLKPQLDILVEAQVAARSEGHGAKVEELDAKIAQFQTAIDQLAVGVDTKKIPLEGDGDPEDTGHKFQSFGHLCYDVVKAGPGFRNASDELTEWQNYVREKATQTAGDLEAGGTLIPTEFSSQILERVAAKSTPLSNAMIIQMATNKIDIPYLEGFDESQGKMFGNVLWYWQGEEKQLTESNFKTGAVELVLRKITGMTAVTGELLKWSPQSIEAIVQRAFDKGLAFAINKACIRGTGAGQPLGVLNATNALVEVAKADGQTATTFIYDNVLDMVMRLYAQEDEDIGDGYWYINKTVLGQLGKLSVIVGAGGSGIFLANQSIQGKPQFSLLGIPIRWSSLMDTLGNAGDVGLFDWTQYLIGQPVGAQVETEQSIHFYFDYDKKAFRLITYIAGQPWWPTDFTPYKGDSQTPFVKLAARA